jgi:hypothetical protein
MWIAAGAVFIFLDFSLFTGFIAIVIAIPIVAVAGALAFLKIDDMPLINYIANMFSFASGPKKYLYTDETDQNDIMNKRK